MTNEMKLLRAFIEAQGYEIEETVVNNEKEIPEQKGLRLIHMHKGLTDNSKMVMEYGSQAYKRGANGSYFIYAKEPITDYKVTKKLFDYTDPLGVVFSGGELSRFTGDEK